MPATIIRVVAIAGLFAACAAGAARAQDAGGAAYAGDAYDPVSGYRCVTPFCDTVALPGTSCLCQKLNPNETRRENVRYACTDMKSRQQCDAPR